MNINNLNINYSKNLILYRTNLYSIKKQNFEIAFYGLSRKGLKTYFKEEPQNQPKLFYKFTLPLDKTLNIIDLEKPETQSIISKFLNNNNTTHKNLTGNNISSIQKAFQFNNNTGKYFRASNNANIDRTFGKALKKIFPYAIGSYTKKSKGLSHAEVIIWDKDTNKYLYEHFEKIVPDISEIEMGGPRKKAKISRTRMNNNNNNNHQSPLRKTLF